jgi:hypothetical protein
MTTNTYTGNVISLIKASDLTVSALIAVYNVNGKAFSHESFVEIRNSRCYFVAQEFLLSDPALEWEEFIIKTQFKEEVRKKVKTAKVFTELSTVNIGMKYTLIFRGSPLEDIILPSGEQARARKDGEYLHSVAEFNLINSAPLKSQVSPATTASFVRKIKEESNVVTHA